MSDSPTPTTSVQVMSRMFALLDVLAREGQAVSLKVASERTGLHPSTAHRILNDLASGGLVERSGPGHYRLGMRLLTLGNLVKSRLDVREQAGRPMQELHRLSGHVVSLFVRQDDEAVCVERTVAEQEEAIKELRTVAEAAAETGLAIGTPVTCGTIDAGAVAVSVGVQHPGQMMMMYGSTIFIIQVTAQPVHDARLWYAPWLFPGTHASMAGLATSGTLTHWFRDQLARDTDFPTLVAEAQESPKGAKGLLCLPYFSGERTPIHDPHARGAFFGLNLTHTRADMFRAVVEGIAAD